VEAPLNGLVDTLLNLAIVSPWIAPAICFGFSGLMLLAAWLIERNERKHP
jgi:hypothetical protein